MDRTELNHCSSRCFPTGKANLRPLAAAGVCWIFMILALTGCHRAGDLEVTGSPLLPTLAVDFSHQDSRAACQFSSACILMPVGVCGNIQAIHVSQVGLAEAYTRQEQLTHPLVQCAPNLPIEVYEPLCLNQRCRAVVREYDLVLEVPEQPVAGQPFWIGMRFQYHAPIELLEARFLLPEGVEVVGGQESWRGPVEAGVVYVLWVEVMTRKTGDLYLMGWTGIQQGDSSIPPLSWSEHIQVASPQALTPWPAHEYILPSPTPEP